MTTTSFRDGLQKGVNSNNWFFPAMFLIFMTLKLTNVINWSWWWVTAPLWMPVVVVLAIIVIAILILLPYEWMKSKKQ